MAVLHCFFVCPAWVTEWRTGQQSWPEGIPYL
jgi:hypothetical protein